MFHFEELLEVSSTEFQIIESPLSVSIVNMSDFVWKANSCQSRVHLGYTLKLRKREDDLIPTANGKWVFTESMMLHFQLLLKDLLN